MADSFKFKPDIAFASRRSPVVCSGGIVACSQPLAAAAGIRILEEGGNAADAAVATAAALNVTEPTSTGIGGDCFALYFEATSKKVYALNGSGRSPQALTLQKVYTDGFSESLPRFHPHTITVPGAAAGWADTVSRFGALNLATVLVPAINLAENGFPVAPITALFWESGLEHQLKNAPNGEELTINGQAPKQGDVFRNPGLAKTLRKLAGDGPEAFYQGEIAEAIVKVIQDEGGTMSLADLSNHRSDWVEPISTTYHGYRLWECPPNGQGLAALLALNIVENFDLEPMPQTSPPRLHLLIEAMRLAFADTRWYVSDPEKFEIPISELLSKNYAAERANLIDLSKATIDQERGSPTSGTDTVYLSVIDKDGNACSFINSNYMGFGTGFVPAGWGFTLQNRGHGFSLDPSHPNALAPGKRPYHTIIPSMITREGSNELFACFGVMGGFMQPQGHLQIAINLINEAMDPQSALDAPRFCIPDGRSDGRVSLEEGITVETMSALANLGHLVKPVSGHGRAIFGRGQVILRDPISGVLWGGSDPRSDGMAMPTNP